MSTVLDTLKASLALNFRYNKYDEAIVKLRMLIKENHYQGAWDSITDLIINRKLKKGEPLSLVHNDANLLLYDDTDEEAYRWLDLMIINSFKQGDVIPYEDSEVESQIK